MNEASVNLEFEKAIEYRELLGSVRQIAQKQKMTHTDGEDKDIIAYAADDRDAVVQVFFSSAAESLLAGITFMCVSVRRMADRRFWIRF